MSSVLELTHCTPELRDHVGGKALGLGHLLRQSLAVPSGFVVTSQAYRDWLEHHQAVKQEMVQILERSAGVVAEEQASEQIRAMFEEAELPDALGAEILEAYRALDASQAAPVAVRSSATAEDTADASFAGQQDTYLWITGAEALLEHVVRCWGSLFTPQAIAYRRHLGIPVDEVAMAVVVQQMVEAEAAGVMITIDPVNGDRSQISIEGSFGLGLAVVGGEVTPDRWSVDKVTMEVRSRVITPKPFAYRLHREAGEVRRFDLAPEEGGEPCLQEQEVIRLAEIGKLAERALAGAQDIEWAVGPGPEGPRQLFMLQVRPETVWSRKKQEPLAGSKETAASRAVGLMIGGSPYRKQ
jgi:phosphoenolpyruvate synthase/pyruvate phosphate dikinase